VCNAEIGQYGRHRVLNANRRPCLGRSGCGKLLSVVKSLDDISPIISYLLQLGLALLAVLGATDFLGYTIIKAIAPHADLHWIIRNICFVTGISFGLASILFFCENIGAAIATCACSNLLLITEFIIGSVNPGLKWQMGHCQQDDFRCRIIKRKANAWRISAAWSALILTGSI
jgi:hypothetical protein